MKKTYLALFFVFTLIIMQGCVLPPDYGCIDNEDEIIANSNTKPVLKITGATVSIPDNPGSYDCTMFDNLGYCIIYKIYKNSEFYQFEQGIKAPACFDKKILGDECEFGCSYYVCVPYSSPQGTKESSVSPADAEQKSRVDGEEAVISGSSLTDRTIGFMKTPRNFLHMKCRIIKLDEKTFKQLKKSDAVFSTFRFGFGRNFDDYEIASKILPVSSTICGINSIGGVEQFVYYLSPTILSTTEYRCDKNPDNSWSIYGYLPEIGQRENKFSTFAECMHNSNSYYLKSSTVKEPFVAESFCYSQDYTNKKIPYFDEVTQKPYSSKIYSITPDLTNINALDDKNKDIFLDLLLKNYLKLGNLQNQQGIQRERYDDVYISSGQQQILQSNEESKTIDLLKQDNTEYANLKIYSEGEDINSAYLTKFATIPEYYHQFESGSMDRQGRFKTGAEFECNNGIECYSGFCDTNTYNRFSCVATDGVNNFEIPCGCTQISCNYLRSQMKLFDDSTVEKYLIGEDLRKLSNKVLVLENARYGEGIERFMFKINDDSPLSEERKFWSGVIVDDHPTTESACKKYAEGVYVYAGNGKYCSIDCSSKRSIQKENPLWNNQPALSIKNKEVEASSKSFYDESTNKLYIMNYLTKNNQDFSENFAKNKTLLIFPYNSPLISSQDKKFFVFRGPYTYHESNGNSLTQENNTVLINDSNSNKLVDIGERCIATEGGAYYTSFLNTYFYLDVNNLPVTPFRSTIGFGSVNENYLVDENSNYGKVLKYLANTASSTSANDFGIVNCVQGLSYEYHYCVNPYIYKYWDSSVLSDANLVGNEVANWYNTYKNDAFCESLPPSYYCLGRWNGDENTGTCTGDMALGAAVFAEDVSDNKFGKCVFDEKSTTKLQVKSYGWCESCSVFNMAFEKIEASDITGYPVFQALNGNFDKSNLIETGKIYKMNPFYLNDRYSKKSNAVGNTNKKRFIFDYFTNPQYATFIDPITKKEVFSGSVRENYDISWQRRHSDDSSCHGNHENTFNFDEDQFGSEKTICYDTSNSKLDLAGIYTFKSFKYSRKEVYGLESSPAFTEDDFYPSRYTLKKRIQSYLSRGVLPVLFADDNELYKTMFSTTNNLEEDTSPGSGRPGPDNDEVDGSETAAWGVPEGFDVEDAREWDAATFAYKILRDVQDLKYDYKEYSGFSEDNQGPIGGALVLTNKLKVWPTGAGTPRTKTLIYYYSNMDYCDSLAACCGYDPNDACCDEECIVHNDYYYDYDGIYISNSETGAEEFYSSGDLGEYAEQDCDHDGTFETCNGPCENVPACAALLAPPEQTTKRGLVHISFNGDIDDASTNNNKLSGFENAVMPGKRMKLVKDEKEGCPTCQTGIYVDFTDINYKITSNPFDKTTELEKAFCGFFAGNLNSPSNTFADSSKYYSTNPCGCLRPNQGVNSKPENSPARVNYVSCNHEEFNQTNIIVLGININAENLDDTKVEAIVNNLVRISHELTVLYGKPIIYNVKSLTYKEEKDLNLLFSYMNFRKPDLISAGTMGIQFEDVVSPSNIASLEGTSKNFYLVRPTSSGGVEGVCSATRNLLPITGLINIKADVPITMKKECSSQDCIDLDTQCINENLYGLKCIVKRGDGTIKSFEIPEYDQTMLDYIGLSLSQTGYSFCPKNDLGDVVENTTTFKTLPVPSQYVIPITFSQTQDSSLSCYPGSVTPQELSEIFTSGIKFATCYPVLKNPRGNEAPIIIITEPEEDYVLSSTLTVSAEAYDTDGIETISISVTNLDNGYDYPSEICSRQNQCSKTYSSLNSGNYLVSALAKDIYGKTSSVQKQFEYEYIYNPTCIPCNADPEICNGVFKGQSCSIGLTQNTHSGCEGTDQDQICSCECWGWPMGILANCHRIGYVWQKAGCGGGIGGQGLEQKAISEGEGEMEIKEEQVNELPILPEEKKE